LYDPLLYVGSRVVGRASVLGFRVAVYSCCKVSIIIIIISGATGYCYAHRRLIDIIE